MAKNHIILRSLNQKHKTHTIMKNLFISFSLLLVSAFSFGQSVLIEPSSSSKPFNLKSTGGEYGNFSTTASTGADLNFLLSATGDGSTGTVVGLVQTFPNKFRITAQTAFNLVFANNNTDIMTITPARKVGIGNDSPAGKLHINHLASSAEPTIHLQSTGTSSSIIKATSTNAGIWENHFLPSNTAGSNLVYWTNSVNSSTPLILTGEGDVVVERNASIGGFTSLGNDISTPKIKMKKLTLTNGATGIATPIAHGLTQSKILSVSVFINASTGNDIPPRSTYTGFEYDYFVSSTQIFIRNISGNDVSIVGRPVRILVTYEE